MEGWLRVVLNHAYLSPTLYDFLPFLGRGAGEGLEAAEEGGAGGEAGFVGHVVQEHVRMLAHQALGVLDAVAGDHRGEFLPGQAVQDSTYVCLVGRQFGGDVGDA